MKRITLTLVLSAFLGSVQASTMTWTAAGALIPFQVTKLLANDGQAHSHFGNSVAFNVGTSRPESLVIRQGPIDN